MYECERRLITSGTPADLLFSATVNGVAGSLMGVDGERTHEWKIRMLEGENWEGQISTARKIDTYPTWDPFLSKNNGPK